MHLKEWWWRPHSKGKKDDDNKIEEGGGKDTPKSNLWLDRIEQLLKHSSMFNNYLTNYSRFTLISKEKLPIKLNMWDIKFYETENFHHYMRNLIGAMTLKGIDRDVFHLIFPWNFDKDILRWYDTLDRWRFTNWDDLCKKFKHQYPYNVDLPVTLEDLELIK